MEDASRRDVLRTVGSAGSAAIGVGVLASAVAAETTRPQGGDLERHSDTSATVTYPSGRELTLTYDESLVQEYQPQLVLEDVSPDPISFHALHAESNESTLNAVYGWTLYPFQEGLSSHDSHLGDHEPVIVWYDQSSGDVVRVDYAAYHWFRGTTSADILQYADDAQHRPMLRVDPKYHHYYTYSGRWPGEQLPLDNLLGTIDGWLNNGLESELALTQPFDPWDMLGRETWWRHTRGNYVDALLKSLHFNLGISGATETADVGEVSTW